MNEKIMIFLEEVGKKDKSGRDFILKLTDYTNKEFSKPDRLLERLILIADENKIEVPKDINILLEDEISYYKSLIIYANATIDNGI